MTDLESQIENYVTTVIRKGGLNSQARLFLAMSIGQAAKGVGCSLAELRFLGHMPKGRVKSGLAQFQKFRILRLGATTYSIRTRSVASYYLPSWWARGRTVERMSGPLVPSYELSLANRDIVIQVLDGVAKRFTANDFVEDIRRKVIEAPDREWKGYVSFARILLVEIGETIGRARLLYGEFLPTNVECGIEKALTMIHDLEKQLNRADVSDLLGSVERVLLKAPL